MLSVVCYTIARRKNPNQRLYATSMTIRYLNRTILVGIYEDLS